MISLRLVSGGSSTRLENFVGDLLSVVDPLPENNPASVDCHTAPWFGLVWFGLVCFEVNVFLFVRAWAGRIWL